MNDAAARTRLDELLVDRALCGLEDAEAAELDGLLSQHPELDHEATDRAVAAIDVAMGLTREPLPAELRARLDRCATDWAADRQGLVLVGSPADDDAARRRTPPTAWLPWAVAAAAIIGLAVALVPRSAPGPERLVAGGAAVVPWAENEAGVDGAVIWSGDRQAGWMRFEGLAPNDPSIEQYQLWIFDAARDERYPVDGGVFDVPAGGGPVEVPIDPRLPVSKATLFAVTIEPPGGVVVSDRTRLILVAQPE